MSELHWTKTCQMCLQKQKSTSHRTVKTKMYVGPCGDSFCYASCDMETCRPVSGVICDLCAEKLTTK